MEMDDITVTSPQSEEEPGIPKMKSGSLGTASSTQASPDKFGGVSSYSPCLFGKGIVVHARQTYIQQAKIFTKTKLI